jgi:nicotinamide-nucleotide amidase
LNEDIEQLAARLGASLTARGWQVATAESCTGGGVAEAITRIAGSSAWFDRGFITYSNDAKVDLLGVRMETLGGPGAVSEATAREMAEGALRQSRADLAVAVTGIAGPGGAMPGKPVGMVCFAWATLDGRVEAATQQFSGDRASIRAQAVAEALRGLAGFAEREPQPG